MCRWAWLRSRLRTIDEEAKELNRQTRKVNFRIGIGGPYFVSVTSEIFCVDFRKFYQPYGLTTQRPSRHGCSLRLDEWFSFLKLFPELEAKWPYLANARPCYENPDHQSQLSDLSCPYCNPFDSTFDLQGY